MSQLRFRYNAALAIAGVIATIGAVSLLGASLWFAPVLLIPLAVTIWAWRAGTDVDERGLVVRALLAKRGIPWTQVDALVPEQRRVHARLANGNLVTLPGVTRGDLPRLVEASGGAIGAEASTDKNQ